MLLQFSQNPYLKSVLLRTAGTVLAEANPYDAKWGIGLSADHPHARRRHKWRGTNFLGEVLMQVRDEMLANGDGSCDPLVCYIVACSVDNFLCVRENSQSVSILSCAQKMLTRELANLVCHS